MSLKIYETKKSLILFRQNTEGLQNRKLWGKTEEINIKKKKERKISDVSIRELWNADKRSNSK